MGEARRDFRKGIAAGAPADKGVVYELEQYREQHANLLLPDIAISGLSEFHRAVIEKVQLSKDPKQGDIYYDNNARGLVISGKGLAKLAVCAGVVWDIDRTRRTDDRSDHMYVSYQAVGGLRKPDGSIVWYKGEYDLDMDVLRDQLIEQYSRKAREDNPPKDQGWIDYCVSRDFGQKMTHKAKLCETGAKNRVLRKLLGLKTKYSEEELAKPFVMARIVLQPDYSDPEVKRMLLAAHIQSITGLYGPQLPAPVSHPEAQTCAHEEPEDVIDLPHEATEIDEDPDGGPSNDIMEAASRRQDFIDCTAEDQIKALELLARQKGYDLKQLKKPLDEFSAENRLGFYDKLTAMADNDIPY
jgi:hypothetical protein